MNKSITHFHQLLLLLIAASFESYLTEENKCELALLPMTFFPEKLQIS